MIFLLYFVLPILKYFSFTTIFISSDACQITCQSLVCIEMYVYIFDKL